MRSGVSAFEDAIGELTKLSQQSTVCAYQERFKSLTEEFLSVVSLVDYVTEEDSEGTGLEIQVNGDPSLEEEMQISIQGLSGCISFCTMKGHCKGRTTILIDLGSTHNLVEPGVVKNSGHLVEPTSDLPVTMADGTKLCCKGVCKSFTWDMQGKTFNAEVQGLAIGGCDMVLAV
ncbi:hypothetical protein RHSIM_RhsimUnG0031000 [Rhododendron simsii]|uniref:Uncharacterized protein n=1 Tax=Rhododendron simsii TaxID=118357 RepID=A0A834L5N4_RHOSS|nr:hypothetical protein RHSIM_RhsimUnG0031000 [Rhododendron simsii]